MASTHSHRRHKAHHSHRLPIVGAVTGVIGVVAVAGLVVALRSGDTHASAPETVAATTLHVGAVKTGTALDISTPDGYTYRMGAVDGGSNGRSKTGRSSTGSAAYIDYVLTNTQRTPALLDFPGDLFVKHGLVAAGVPCQPQTGAPADTCSVRNHSQIISNMGSAAPTLKDGDQYIAGNSSYLVRITTDPVLNIVPTQSDLALYVWDERFIPSGVATLVPFP
jgi:hypothetical protein